MVFSLLSIHLHNGFTQNTGIPLLGQGINAFHITGLYCLFTVDALWAVNYITGHYPDDDSLQIVLDSGVVGGVVRHLASEQKQKIVPALRATGNIVIGNDEQVS